MRNPTTIWVENVPYEDEPLWSTDPRGLRTPHPYRRVRVVDTPPKAAIFLEPACADESPEGRTWSQDDPWGGKCDECGARVVAYAPVWDWQRKPEAWRRA